MNETVEQLELRRNELAARIDAIHRDLRGGLEKDYEEQSVQLENFEVLQEIARVAELELKEVDLKLARLKQS
jgi:RNA polymerase-binding transcription factor DksA